MTKKKDDPNPSKIEQLLSDIDVKRWHDNLAAGSPLTAERWTRRLGRYCELNNLLPLTKGPKMLWHLAPKRQLVQANYNLLLDTIRKMEKESYDSSYIKGMKTSVTSWLRFGGIHLEYNGTIKIKDDINPTTVRTPEVHEVREIFAASPLRGMCSVALISWAGLRLESLGNSDGTDGLRLKDFPELNIQELRFETIPARVTVRAPLSKAGHQYFSFLPRKGTDVIISYLKDRVEKKKEILNPDTALIKAFGNKIKPGEFVGTPYISWEISRVIAALEKAQVMAHCRPNDLRSFFDTQMLIAENRGKIAHDFRVFWMGHVGSIEAIYTTNRLTLSNMLFNEMREAYNRASPLLLESINPEEIRKEVTESVEKKLQDMMEAHFNKYYFGQSMDEIAAQLRQGFLKKQQEQQETLQRRLEKQSNKALRNPPEEDELDESKPDQTPEEIRKDWRRMLGLED